MDTEIFEADNVSPPPEAAEGKSYEALSEEERAVRIPDQIFELKKNEPGFIFSRENLQTIRRYEAAVRQLPPRAEVERNTAYPVLGLNVEDISRFFENLLVHANSWKAIEEACKRMGNDLQVFSESFLVDGNELINAIKAIGSWDDEVDTPGGTGTALSTEDVLTFRQKVDHYLPAILEEITQCLTGIETVKALVKRYGDDINDNLKPMASGLLNRIKSEQLVERLAAVESELLALDKEIQKQLEQYNGLVGEAFKGLIFGPIGLIVTGGLYGSQAESVRKNKNRLIAQREKLSKEKTALLGGAEGFEEIRTHIVDTEFRLVDVLTAVKNLEDVWGLLIAYATSSQRRAQRVSTQQELKDFVRSFGRVIRPWENIHDISMRLSMLFNEAVKPTEGQL